MTPKNPDDRHYLERELYDQLQHRPDIVRFLIDQVLDGAWYWDLENPDHEWMSPKLWHTLGYDPEEKSHLASEWMDLVDPSDFSIAKQQLDAHLADPKKPYELIARYTGGDGNTVSVQCKGMAIRDDDGKPVRLLGAHVDVTDFVKQADEAHTARRLLESVIGATHSAIIGLNANSQVVVANDAARHVLGGVEDPIPFAWPADVRFQRADTFDELDSSAHPVSRGLAGFAEKDVIYSLSRANSTEARYVRFSSQYIPDTPEEARLVVVIDDITAEFQKKQDDERAIRLDALGQLTGGIAHDFNNILGAILPSIEIALHKVKEPEIRRPLELALSATFKGAELSRRLLSFASRQPVMEEDVGCSKAIEDVIAIASRALEASIHIEFVPPKADLFVLCDRVQLEAVILNLLINARDAIVSSGSGNKISLAVRRIQTEARLEGQVEIMVMDDGPGMTREIRARAVDPFFTTKPASSGSGLGLSMAYGFCKQSGGNMHIYSEPGGGTTVSMTFPEAKNTDREWDFPTPDKWADGGGLSVLVAEDELELRGTMESLLEMLGYRCVVTSSAEEALALVRKGHRFDILLTDIVMGGAMNGFQLAEKISALHPEVAVIYMSGYTGFAEDKRMTVEAQMVQKPCDISLLSQALVAAVEGEKAV